MAKKKKKLTKPKKYNYNQNVSVGGTFEDFFDVQKKNIEQKRAAAKHKE